MLDLSKIDRLLDPSPLPMEVGYERLTNGVLHVSCRTDMHRCTGEMFEWWFRSRPDTRQYIWWHPVDHISSEWRDGTTNTHIGSSHIVEERLTDVPATKLTIQFRDNEEFFDPSAYSQARSQGDVSASVCGRLAMGHEPDYLSDGGVVGGRLLHIGRDADWGLVLRSHFYVGQDLPDLGISYDQMIEMFPDTFGQSLLMHAYNEFTSLSKFLPSLYTGDNRDTLDIKLPW